MLASSALELPDGVNPIEPTYLTRRFSSAGEPACHITRPSICSETNPWRRHGGRGDAPSWPGASTNFSNPPPLAGPVNMNINEPAPTRSEASQSGARPPVPAGGPPATARSRASRTVGRTAPTPCHPGQRGGATPSQVRRAQPAATRPSGRSRCRGLGTGGGSGGVEPQPSAPRAGEDDGATPPSRRPRHPGTPPVAERARAPVPQTTVRPLARPRPGRLVGTGTRPPSGVRHLDPALHELSSQVGGHVDWADELLDEEVCHR